MNHHIFLVTFPACASMPAGDVTPSTPAGECIVGEAISFAPKSPAGAASIEVVSAPEGSTANPNGMSFTADVPGVYTLRLHNGTAATDHRRVAFHPEALDWPDIADANQWRRQSGGPSSPFPPALRSEPQRRLILRGIAAYAPCEAYKPWRYGDVIDNPAKYSDDDFAELTPDNPLPAGLCPAHF